MQHLAAGGGLVTWCRTIPHDHTDTFADVLGRYKAAWRALGRLYAWKQVQKRYGIEGAVWGADATLGGVHGPHPHRHGVWFTSRPLSPDELDALDREAYTCWKTACEKVSAGAPLHRFNYAKGLTGDPAAVARYVYKASCETLRADLKHSDEHGASTPFQVLGAFERTGDDALLALWNDYEQATRGECASRWSPGLKTRYGIGEMSDEEAASAEVEGEEVEELHVRREDWRVVQSIPGGVALVLLTMRDDSKEGLLRLLSMWKAGRARGRPQQGTPVLGARALDSA